MGSQKIKLTINSVMKNVSLVGMATNKICSSLNFNEKESCRLELCVVEAVNNCIEHAYQGKSCHEIEVIVEILPDRIAFKVCDTGKTMEPGRAPNFEFDPDDKVNLPEGGMGRFIIHQIMDEVIYESSGGENILTMTKKLPMKA